MATKKENEKRRQKEMRNIGEEKRKRTENKKEKRI